MQSQQVKNHELTTVDISTIVFDESNPNKLTQKQMEGLRQSMLKYGYLTPVIIDQNNVVADGEHRALVYKQLGYTQIPVYRVTLETDADRKILRQIMNKLHGEHDKQLDSNELLEIFQANKLTDLSTLIAQQQYDLQQAIRQYHPDIFFTNEQPMQQKDIDEIVPTTQLGDLYQLGQHRLICGDCTDKRITDKLLDGIEAIHQLNTDPPFGVELGQANADRNARDNGIRISTQYDNDNLDTDYYVMFENIFRNIASKLSEYNTVYVFSGDKQMLEIAQAFKNSGIFLSTILVWLKDNQTRSRTDYAYQNESILYGWKDKHKFYGGFRTNILQYKRLSHQTMHPASRPVDLMQQLITDGTEANNNILDLFAGSGSTLIACEETNRNFFGVEIDPHYCDVIINRWEKYTSKKAEKIQ